MINKIYANIDKNHIYHCDTKQIGRQGENECTQLEITLEDCLCDSWVYLHFEKPDGETRVTKKLEIVDNKVIYEIGNDLLDVAGELKVFVELHKETGLVWRSSIKRYTVLDQFDGTEQIENKDDFLTNAQKVLDETTELKKEVETGLTPTIGENENWFICGVDTGKPSRGKTYEITNEDYQEIEEQVKEDLQPVLDENVQKMKEYTDNEIARFDFIKIVQELPETGLPNRTYFVAKTNTDDNDLYDEYMWVNKKWESLGTKRIEVDLTNCLKKDEVAEEIFEITYDDGNTKTIKSVVFK